MGEHHHQKIPHTGIRRTWKLHIQYKEPESKPIFIFNYYISVFSCLVFLRFLGLFGSQNSSNNSCP